MINMETLFKNHFNTNKISDDNIQKFAEAASLATRQGHCLAFIIFQELKSVRRSTSCIRLFTFFSVLKL